ncbi:Uncharacterized protein APZ42_031280 [Daphnia magna]|uniref:CCHC-type domain-containing protein n=1 Tax=Daphnia magna TaxID=35525 RepID=A0A164MZ18_9CRUS|nr:Uncharacterized protein APZ42_031280 [Daphnia magna]
MQRQLSNRRNLSFSQRSPQSNPPINKTGDLYFCYFHNDRGFHSINNCKARESQANDKCFRCKEIGHRANVCPQIKNLKPSPPEEEAPHQALRQKLIIVNGIVEDIVLGPDALWKHQFIFNGRQQSIYRFPEIDHFQETENPFVISKCLRIPLNSTSLLGTREEEIHPFNPLNTCHFVRYCNIPSRLSLEPYISTIHNHSLHVVAVNGTDKTIFLPHLTVLGTLRISTPSRKPVETMALIREASDSITTAAVESALPDMDEENKENLRRLIINNYNSFFFKQHTTLVKHVIDTQGQGLIRQRAYRTSPKQKEIAKNIIEELMQSKIIRYSMSPWAAPIVLVRNSLINTLPYGIDKLLPLSLHPALTPHPMSTAAAIAEIISAAKEEHSSDLGNPFHMSTLLS